MSLKALPPGALTGALTNLQNSGDSMNSKTGLDSLRANLIGHNPANLGNAAETKITEGFMA